MLVDDLQQFIMVSPEVWQDLHWRYSHSLWPWWMAFVLCNGLVLIKSKQALVFTYAAFCWIFIGVVYFMHYVQQVHNFATVMGCVFVLQGLALLYFKVLRSATGVHEKFSNSRRVALWFYGGTAIVPVSYALDKSKESILLFGWGAEQTALGTIALVIFSLRSKAELLLVCVPLIWILIYVYLL